MERALLVALVLPALAAGCLGGEPGASVATGQIDGAVVDQLLRPYGNQTVYLSPLGWTDATSRLGGFTFRDVPVGTYTVLAAKDGTRGGAAVVDVEEGRITKTILQLLPFDVQPPYLDIVPHSSFADTAFPGTVCADCAWEASLDEHPEEVVFEARWEATTLGFDGMRFQVTDDQGDVLYQSPVETDGPVTISIAGADIPDDARTLRVTATFGSEFTPRANFRMESVLTLYHGATKAELFGT
jgi:hypothetical protein